MEYSNDYLKKFLFKIKKVPKDFQSVLNLFTKKGYRVVAIGAREIDLNLVKTTRIERFLNEKSVY
jgi:hypothetical protein